MEKEAADRLPAEWDEVVLKSKNVDASLRIVKRKFTQARRGFSHTDQSALCDHWAHSMGP